MGVLNPRFGDGGARAAMGNSTVVVADGATGLAVFYTTRTPRGVPSAGDIGPGSQWTRFHWAFRRVA